MLTVALVAFLTIRLIPGNPAEQVLGSKATPTAVAQLQHQLGLDRPLLAQLSAYLSELARVDLGQSLVEQGRSVTSIVLAGLGVTGSLIALTVVISLLVSVPTALWAAARRGGAADSSLRTASVLSLASPPFLIGLLLIVVFPLKLGFFPAGGWGSGWSEHLRHLFLPAIALSAYLGPLVFRTVRQAAAEVNNLPFVDAALARGIPRWQVTARHVLPNALLPAIALVALNVGWLISGAVVIETIFALPGLGTVLAQAVAELDYTVIQGAALIAAAVVVLVNLAADLLVIAVDPRARRTAR
jgi:peptide/nickel transport system permease protein